jgi:kinesin family protein 13
VNQRKPVFPPQPGSGFVQQPDQQQNNPRSPVAVQQQQQQQHLLQHQRQQQLLQLQQQQQRQHFQQHQQLPVQHQQQQHLFTQHPQQQLQQEKQQKHSDAEIVKSVSQQLHLSPNRPPNQQELLNSNTRFQQQPSPTQSTLIQPLFSQQTPTRQHPQSVLPTPVANNYSVPQQLFSSAPSSTIAPTTVTTPKQQDIKTEVTGNKEGDKDKNAVNPSVLAALPDEVPEDLRQQLLSSGILSNADIQILDYDKVGDIPIENLPPEALENFYGAAGAASAPVPSIVAVNGSDAPVEMKVVRYDPDTAEGQEVAEKYVRKDATQVDPVVLNDSKYNRYLPLKVSGAQFPLPDVPELRGRNITSVVVLAPVDYDFQEKQSDSADDDSDRSSRAAPVELRGVKFVAGHVLKELVKEPTYENFKRWLDKENATDADRQSVVLLVAG